MSERRYKPLGIGLPGPAGFAVSELSDGSGVAWSTTTNKWEIGTGNSDSGAIGDMIHASKASDTARDTTTTISDDPELQVSLAFASRFTFEASIKISSTNSEGYRFAWAGPSTMSYRYVTTDADGSNVLSSGSAQVGDEITITDVGTDQVINFIGSISSVGAATLSLQWAQETSSGTSVTTREDSWVRVIRLTELDGSAPPPTLDAFITTLTPEYWWDFQEALAADDYLDSGAAAVTVNMDSKVATAPSIVVAAPTNNNQSRDWSSFGNWARTNPGLPILGGATGSLVAFFRVAVGAGLDAQVMFSCDSANETNNISFGIGARGITGGAHNGHFSIIFLNNGNFTTYRAIVADDSITTLGLDDNLWHQVIWTYTGSIYTITVDTTILATTTYTAGAPVGDNTWFETNIAPTRTYMGNGRYSTGSGNLGHDMGPLFVLKNQVMTPAQIVTMHGYL